jgi:ABC-2 type transport system ATP-binding protein
VDIGTPAELVRRHCTERTVIVATEDSAALDRFRAIPLVESVSRQGQQFTIRGRGEDLVTEVIHCLAEHRLRVTDFRTELPTLEDVFLKLTGHLIRD